MSATHVGRAWSCTVRLVVDDERALRARRRRPARAARSRRRAASRFRADSALSHANAHAGRPVPVPRLLVDLVDAALRMAAHTDGAVDPDRRPRAGRASATTATSARSPRTARRSRRASGTADLARRAARPRGRPADRPGRHRARPRRDRQGVHRRPRRARRSPAATAPPCWSNSAATSPSPATVRTAGACRSPSARAATAQLVLHPRRRPGDLDDHRAAVAARRRGRSTTSSIRAPARRPTGRGAPPRSPPPTRCTRTPRAPRRSCSATAPSTGSRTRGYAARLVAHDGAVHTTAGWPARRGGGGMTRLVHRARRRPGRLAAADRLDRASARSMTGRGTAANRVVVQYVHRVTASLGLGVLVLHITTILADSYAHVGWRGAIVPFTRATGRPGSGSARSPSTPSCSSPRSASPADGWRRRRAAPRLARAARPGLRRLGPGDAARLQRPAPTARVGWVRLLYVACGVGGRSRSVRRSRARLVRTPCPTGRTAASAGSRRDQAVAR